MMIYVKGPQCLKKGCCSNYTKTSFFCSTLSLFVKTSHLELTFMSSLGCQEVLDSTFVLFLVQLS